MIDKSHLTAMRRNKLSAPVSYLLQNNLIKGLHLDYGCGRGWDADKLHAVKYDPFYFNHDYIFKGKYDTITCVFVLNAVVQEVGQEILNKIKSILTPEGRAYIVVRRDVEKDGLTKKGTYQRNVILDLPKVYELNKRFCIYLLTNAPQSPNITQ